MLRKTIISIIALIAASSSYAQSSVAQTSTTDLNMQLDAMLATGDYKGSRAYANELIKRFEGGGAGANRETLNTLYYVRAFGYYQDFLADKKVTNLNEAISDLDKVIASAPTGANSKPSKKIREAIDLKAICYESQGKYGESAKALAILLNPPFVYQLRSAEQLDLLRRIVRNFYSQRDWKGNDKWFLKLLDEATLDDDKMMAASALMQGAIEAKKYDEAMKYLPYTTLNAPTRYDISLNIAFLNAARELSSDKVAKYADAAVFYSLCYNKARIVEYFENYKKEAQARLEEIKAANPKSYMVAIVEARVTTANNQLKGLKKVEEYASILMFGKAINYQATERMYECYWAYTQLIAYFPNSKEIEDYYFAAFQAALAIEKQDDMASLGVEYIAKFPKGKYIKNIKFDLTNYYYEKKMHKEFFKAAKDYIAHYSNDGSCEKTVYQLGETYILQLADYQGAIDEFEFYLNKYPKTVVRGSLHYWLGFAAMGTEDFVKSYDNLYIVVTNHPDSLYIEDASFRVSLAAYAKQDLDTAITHFDHFLKTFPHNILCGQAEVYLGKIYYAKSDLDNALKHYALVEEKSQDLDCINEAYLESIKIQNQKEKYREVVNLTNRYMEKYPDGNIAIMLYEKASAQHKIGEQGFTVKTFKELIVRFGEDPSLSGVDKALAEYNKNYSETNNMLNDSKAFAEKTLVDSKLLSMLVNDPAERYKYFLLPENKNIDNEIYLSFKNDKAFSFEKILFNDKQALKDLLAHLNEQIEAVPTESPAKFFNSLLEKAKGKSLTLEIRAMAALDSIGENIPSRIFTEEDFSSASPASLIWVAEQNAKRSKSEGIKTYKYVLGTNAESTYLFDALFGIAKLYEEQGQYTGDEGAVFYYNRLENEQALDPRIWKITIEYANCLSKMGGENILKAKEKLDSIRRNSNWKGEPVAAALYYLGQLEEKEGNDKLALNYYLNCAIGHSNFTAYSGKAALAQIKLIQRMPEDTQPNKDGSLPPTNQEKIKNAAMAFLNTASASQTAEYDEIKYIYETL